MLDILLYLYIFLKQKHNNRLYIKIRKTSLIRVLYYQSTLENLIYFILFLISTKFIKYS